MPLAKSPARRRATPSADTVARRLVCMALLAAITTVITAVLLHLPR